MQHRVGGGCSCLQVAVSLTPDQTLRRDRTSGSDDEETTNLQVMTYRKTSEEERIYNSSYLQFLVICVILFFANFCFFLCQG